MNVLHRAVPTFSQAYLLAPHEGMGVRFGLPGSVRLGWDAVFPPPRGPCAVNVMECGYKRVSKFLMDLHNPAHSHPPLSLSLSWFSVSFQAQIKHSSSASNPNPHPLPLHHTVIEDRCMGAILIARAPDAFLVGDSAGTVPHLVPVPPCKGRHVTVVSSWPTSGHSRRVQCPYKGAD